jgi:hypothetical protein
MSEKEKSSHHTSLEKVQTGVLPSFLLLAQWSEVTEKERW